MSSPEGILLMQADDVGDTDITSATRLESCVKKRQWCEEDGFF